MQHSHYIMAVALCLSTGCSEQEFNSTSTVSAEISTVCTTPSCLKTPGLPITPNTEPPEEIFGCDNPAATADWGGDEIYVSMNNKTQVSGTLQVSGDGLFHVYSAYSAESGDAQWNESAYYRIKNNTEPDGLPKFGNCGDDWVVEDTDNYVAWPEDTYIYIGTFHLDSGDNELWLNHYCDLYDQGFCEEFHFEEEATSTCESNNPNSAHFPGDLCLISANPS